jgi:hypothetical protein
MSLNLAAFLSVLLNLLKTFKNESMVAGVAHSLARTVNDMK